MHESRGDPMDAKNLCIYFWMQLFLLVIKRCPWEMVFKKRRGWNRGCCNQIWPQSQSDSQVPHFFQWPIL